MANATISQSEQKFIQASDSMNFGRGEIHDQPVWASSRTEVRALALAARYGMTAAWVRHYTGAADGSWTILRVQSHSDCTKRHEVTYHPRTDTFSGCSCPAYGPCCHLGAARLRVERDKLARAMAERQAECERQYQYFDSLDQDYTEMEG